MADTPISEPATHRQPSRKGKKAWRKNVDLTDVQSGLQTARDEIIKTGGVIAEKQADELFATDITGDAEVARKQQGKKLLKADEIIALRSAVPGLEQRKRKAAEAGLVGAGKRQKNGKYVSHRELERLRDVADGVSGGVVVDDQAEHDPWAMTVKEVDARLDYLDEVKPAKEPKTLKYPPKSLTANGKHMPNVRKPDAGKSYNPLVGDWSALLDRAGAAAVSAEQNRLAIEAEAEAAEARATAEAAKVEEAEKEAYATDYDSAWESEWDGFQSDAEEVGLHKDRPRKTPVERNKVKARKVREGQEAHDRKSTARTAQEKQISQIAKEFSEKDKARHAHLMALQLTAPSSDSEDDTAEVQLQRLRFGKVAVPDAPLEVVLPDELEDSLRRLKPEGNLMQERYRNLLVSGKVESRRRKWQHKLAKTTRSEKWSYKDWRLK